MSADNDAGEALGYSQDLTDDGGARVDRTDELLHDTEMEGLERRIMDLALERTGARHGAIFLWDEARQGLTVHFHLVDGVLVPLDDVLLRPPPAGQPPGIALTVMDRDAPYLCQDAAADPNYAPYFLEVGSVAAVPIRYQQRAIGVISVSDRRPRVFREAHLAALEELAGASAKFLRRAQLYRASQEAGRRPFLIKGLSPEWLEVERQLEQVAPTDAPVLIQGESGTGKELIAHALHFNSPRADRALVIVNCAAIPETLLESTLFGHLRGAFTGATATKVGEFQKADGGTLFLDEVGELPLSLQAKLLRAVEAGEVQPLGSNRPPVRVDVRLLGATHRDLATLVREGRFRDDLYYRLSVVTLELPPLRRYRHNLPILSRVFLMQAARRHGRPARRLSPEALACVERYPFPGNVRELRNAMERAVIMARGEEIGVEDLPRTLTQAPPPAADGSATPGAEETPGSAPLPGGGRVGLEAGGPLPTLREAREAWSAPREAAYLADLLHRTGGRVREAARLAGVNHVTFYRLLKLRGVAPGGRR